MNKFKAVYGEIPNVSDRDYFSNSMHVPVWHQISPFDKIDIECQLTDIAEAADYKGKNAGNEQEKCMWYKLGFVLDQVLDMCFVANTLLDRLI